MVKEGKVERLDILEEPRSETLKARCSPGPTSGEQLPKEPEQLTGCLSDGPVCWILTKNHEHASCRFGSGAHGGAVNSCRVQIPVSPLSLERVEMVSRLALVVCLLLTVFLE